jgi:hypothetical protein
MQSGIATVGGVNHACVWSGTAATWVDLHAFLPANFSQSAASQVWIDGGFAYVAGYGFNTTLGRNEAMLWKRPYTAPCLADINNDGSVNVSDLLAVISAWGVCPIPNNCPADINDDGTVNVADLLAVITSWGACP